jgi:formamidopyrimidine-DNA glycosylase
VPELPEVETIRRDLEREVAGLTIERVDATGVRTLRRTGAFEPFVREVEGYRLTVADRRGKYLLLRLETGRVVVVHLGMSGQLLYAAPGTPLGPHTHVVWHFGGGPELRFVDPRTFGEVFVSTPSQPGGVPDELAHLGADPFDATLTPATLATGLAGRRTKLKPLLLDQRFVAGIGNMYADEILWAARLGPDRPAAGTSRREASRLHGAIRETLTAAVAHRGSSLADEQYRDLYGEVGRYQARHNAYGREGRPCPRCGSPIRRLKAYGRSTFFCPRCQR